MTDSDPTRIVQLTLMGALLGVAIPYAVSITADDFSISQAFICFAFLCQALLFFHGKVAALGDREYTMLLQAKALHALFDYVMNLAIVLCFVLMAITISEPVLVCVANLLLRVLDLALVKKTKQVTIEPAMRKAQTSWLWFDVFCIVSWSSLLGVLCIGTSDNEMEEFFAAVVFSVVVLADVIMDYQFNRSFYFSEARNWDEMAELWDEVQGESGDSTRQELIVPALRNYLTFETESLVVDMGAGNGCIARQLANSNTRIVAVEQSQSMINCAKRYPANRQIEYVLGSIADESLIGRWQADAVVCCFSHQDAEDASSVFKAAAAALGESGQLLVVYEDLEVLQRSPAHSMTNRRWSEWTTGSVGHRTQIVAWKGANGELGHAIETEIYTQGELASIARSCGYSLVTDAPLMHPSTDSYIRRLYNSAPKFRLAVFKPERS